MAEAEAHRGVEATRAASGLEEGLEVGLATVALAGADREEAARAEGREAAASREAAARAEAWEAARAEARAEAREVA